MCSALFTFHSPARCFCKFIFYPRKSKKSQKKFESQKNSLLLYILVILFFAIRALSTCGEANRPRASYYWPINYTFLLGLHLVCSRIAQGWLNNAISAFVRISIFYCHFISSIMTRTFKIITPVFRITEAYLAFHFSVSIVTYSLLILPLFSLQEYSR